MLTKNTKHIAGISLGVMAGGFIATIPFQTGTWGHILQSGFEAGLVGGLADWFAITALFRHPFGIPIPHTRLLLQNRQKITDSLVSMMETHLLNKASIEEKIGQFQLTAKLLDVIEEEIHSSSVKSGITDFLKRMLESISLDPYADVIEREIVTLANSFDIRPAVEFIVDDIVRQHYDEVVFDFMIEKTGNWVVLEETRNTLGGMAMKAIENLKLHGMMSFAVNAFIGFMNEEKLGGILQSLILSGLADLHKQGNPGRTLILQAVRQELHGLRSNADFLEKLDFWKGQAIGSLCTKDRIVQALLNMKQKLLDSMEKPTFADQFLLPLVVRVIENTRKNPDILHFFDQWIRNKIIHSIEENHSKIGELARENLEKLDDQTLVDMIEEKAGKDLQWIRVNGAICGFLIGIILYFVKLLA